MQNSSAPYSAILASQNFFSRSMSIDMFERDGILASCMGIDNPFFNPVLQTNLDSESLSSVIPDIEAFFAKHNVPWTWLVFPFSEPKNLSDILASQGMKKIETFAVMGLDMEKPLPIESLQKHSIREVVNSKDFDDWSLPLQEGFEATHAETKQFRTLTENIPYGKGNDFHHYVLYVDSAPMAAGTVSLYRGNARLDNISVRSSYQRQGFGTEIMGHMLREAKLMNAKYCFLDASHKGIELYKKLGFEKYYSGQIFGKENE